MKIICPKCLGYKNIWKIPNAQILYECLLTEKAELSHCKCWYCHSKKEGRSLGYVMQYL